MKKIKFSQPKYIIPLILTPFIFLFNFMFIVLFPAKAEANAGLVTTANLNVTLSKPDEKQMNIKDKFTNFKDTYKNQLDFTAINEDIVDDIVKEKSGITDTNYSNSDLEKIARLEDSIEKAKASINDTKEKVFDIEKFKKNLSNDVSNKRSRIINNKSRREKSTLENQKKELSFEEQLKKEMESINAILEPNDKEHELSDIIKYNIPKTKTYEVLNLDSQNNEAFNSISTKKQKNKKRIYGLVDEEITVYSGFRVRIKLSNDIQIGDLKLYKNDYIYGEVSGFNQQRVEISVTNILKDDEIYNVDLSVFDIDGMKGLYVPSSKFRDISQDLGSGAVNSAGQGGNSSSGDSDDSANRIAQITTKAVQSLSQTASKLIKRQRAHLKYNSKVFLINNKK